jgi:PAS domain S-box-containing protein
MLTDDLLKRTSATLSTIKSNEIASKFAEKLFSEAFSIWNLENPMAQFENPTLLKALGYDNREIPIIPPIHPEDLRHLKLTAEETTRKLGDEFEVILRFTHFDQRVLEFRCTGSKISELEYLLHFDPFFERSERFEQLKNSNRRIQSLLPAVRDSYYILDPAYKLISYFQDPQKIPLFSEKTDITGKNILDLGFEPELKTRILDTINKAVSSRTRVSTTFVLKNGNKQSWFCLHVVVLIDDSDNLVEIACAIQDVSKQKKLEMELSQQTLLRQTLIDHIPGWVTCKDYDGKYLFVNETFVNHIGKPRNELIGTTDFNYEPNPELAKLYKAGDQNVIDTGIPSFTRVKDVMLSNGLKRSLDVTKIPIDILGIDKGAVIVIINDVTENERATAEHIRTKLMLEESNRVARIGSWELDLIEKRLFWSPITKLIHEVESEFEPDLETAFNFYPENEFRSKISDLLTDCIENGVSYDTELKILTAKGNERWVRTVGSSRIQNGKCIAIFGSFQDIDLKKREEERLKLLESVVTNTKDTVLIWSAFPISETGDSKPEIIFVNKAFCDTTGYTMDEAVGSGMPFLWGTTTNHELIQEIADKVARLEVCEYELNYFKKNGEESWMSFTMVPVPDSQGLVTHWVLVGRDINESRNAGIELKLAKESLSEKTEILSAISKLAEKLLNSDEINHALNESFELIGRSAKVDRVSYFEINSSSNLLSQKAEWTIEGIETTIEDTRLRQLPATVFSREFDLLLKNKVVQFHTDKVVDSDFREILNSHSVRSFLAFPLFVKNRLVGLIGFDDCHRERHWTDLEIEMYSSLVTNVSNAIERVETEGRIKESESNFRQITETLDAVFWLHDSLNNKYVYMSPACKKVFGVDPKYFYDGNSFNTEFVIDGIDNDFYKQWKDSADQNVSSAEYKINRSDGEIRWIKETGFAIRDEDGICIRTSGFSTDITDEIHKRDQLQHLLNVTGNLNKRLLNFAHIVSHNIRSHSSNLSMLVDFINKSKNETEQLEYVQMLGQSTQKLSETIDNLNEIVKIQNSFRDERTSVNLREEFEKTTAVLSSSILDTKTIIENLIPPEIFVNVIPSYLESIFLNLLTNSIKYRSIERVTTIEVSTQLTQDFIVVKFSDNGIGINLDMHRHKIFGMYKTFHGNIDARGIGLFMTKNQIEVMGGKIEVESQINVGTTFTISFKRNG